MRICFYMGVYLDNQLAFKRLSELIQIYPNREAVNIIVYCDGINHLELSQFCNSYQINYTQANRIKPARFGAKWIARMLRLYLLLSQADVLVRIEPDTKVLRQFHGFPDGDLIGNIRHSGTARYIQGGGVGIKRGAARQILDSKILDDPIYQQFSYRRYQEPYVQPGEGTSNEELLAVDVALSHAADRLGLTFGQWDEIGAFTFPDELAAALPGKDFALLHPCKGES